MLKLIILNVVLKMLDLLTTYLCISKYNSQVEGNPLMRRLMESTGNYAYVITMAFFLLLMAVVYKKQYKGVAVVSAVLCGAAAINNIVAYLLYE